MLWLCIICIYAARAQETFAINGVADTRSGYFAFTNATIVKDAQTTLKDATLIIKQGKIMSVAVGTAIPADAVVIDCKGKFIYPSFIDLYSDYGVEKPKASSNGNNDFSVFQNGSNTKGAFGWNQALKPETDASKLFAASSDQAVFRV